MPKSDQDPPFRLALNLEDLDRIDPISRQKMLHHRIDLENPIRIAKNSTEVGIAFSCKLIDAAIICDIIRSEDRQAGDSPTRIYIKNGSSNWKRTPRDAVFTVTVKGRILLSPQLFNVPIEHTPLEAKRLTFGGK